MDTLTTQNWDDIASTLNNKGYAILPKILNPFGCETLIHQYHESHLYRSTINMQRYRFGKGEYKYFDYPLPSTVKALRANLYTPLAHIANQWMRLLKIDSSFPAEHNTFIESCHAVQQVRPTPLILKYEAGGFNTLHQDLYGAVFFPFQVIFMLTQKGTDYEGGELVLTEQIPRAQSIVKVIHANKGDAVIITTNFRPIQGSKGYYRAKVKHGVSEVKSGTRYTLGIVFHDAA
ncbi:MAG: 2OG-Fe(II) oxygenase [Cyclobacteriaceae bacterium]|nr:2OG-Fe(II) oxygenase [Cyclobacteriaceae bacterium]